MTRARVTPRLIAQALIEEAATRGTDVGALTEAALLLLQKHRLQRDISRFLHTVSVVLDKAKGTRRAHLTVGFGDEGRTAATIEHMLKRTRGGTWTVSSSRDERLLGGVLLRIGDDQIDASLRAALQQLEEQLLERHTEERSVSKCSAAKPQYASTSSA